MSAHEKCYRCGCDVHYAMKPLRVALIFRCSVLGVGNNERTFTLCKPCGELTLIEHSRWPWPPEGSP